MRSLVLVYSNFQYLRYFIFCRLQVMSFLEKSVRLFLRLYPIKSDSPYRFVPLFFVVGGCIEWFMIKFPGAGAGETFYDVWRRNQSQRQYEARIAQEASLSSIDSNSSINHKDTLDDTCS